MFWHIVTEKHGEILNVYYWPTEIIIFIYNF